MPTIDVDAYKANFSGGAKSYLFYYRPQFPSGFGETEFATYLVRATSMPETNIEEITTNWQGQDFRFAGKYTYSDWSVTFNCDVNATIYKSFYKWLNFIHDPTSNKYNAPNDYMMNQNLEMLDHRGLSSQKLVLFQAWPKTVGPITLDYTANDVSTFDVSFAYIYHVIEGPAYGGQVPAFGGEPPAPPA